MKLNLIINLTSSLTSISFIKAPSMEITGSECFMSKMKTTNQMPEDLLGKTMPYK
jgi:hypothetical protein